MRSIPPVQPPGDGDHYLFFDLDGCLYWEGQKRDGRSTWKSQQDLNATTALMHFGMSSERAERSVREFRGSKLLRVLIEDGFCQDHLSDRDTFWNIYNYGTPNGEAEPSVETEFKSFIRPNPESVSFIRSLPAHYRKWVFTNGTESMARYRLKHCGFDPDTDFEGIFGAEFLHPHYKPDPLGYQKVFEHVGIVGQELPKCQMSSSPGSTEASSTVDEGCVLSHPATFFEDTANNLVVPRQTYGMRTVGVMSNPYPPEDYTGIEPTLKGHDLDAEAQVKEKYLGIKSMSDVVVPAICLRHFPADMFE